MSKIYILDTNVLLHDPRSLFAFEDNEVIIPLVVLDELDKKKVGGHDETARHARMVIRSLDKMRLQGSIHKGAQTPAGGIVRVELNHCDQSVPDLDPNRVDNRLIGVALGLKKEQPERTITLITKDINLRVKCDAIGVVTADYNADSVAESASSIYEGSIEVSVSSEVIDKLYRDGFLHAEGYGEFNENQYVFLNSNTRDNHTSLAKYSGGTLVSVHVPNDVWGISSRNKEQAYALDALFSPDIKLVTMIGKAGSGKTLCAVAAGISQVLDSHEYKKLIMTRPVQPMGRDLGYLPGPQPLDAKILTPSGWTTMGELKVGDRIIAKDGSPTKILNIYPKGKKKVYRVVTTEGNTECCLDHLWHTRTFEDKKRGKNGTVKSTYKILNTIKTKKEKINHYLPRNGPVVFDEKKLLIPPYTLGVILGDGCIGNSISIINTNKELLNRVSEEIKVFGCSLTRNSNTITYTINGNLKHNKPARPVKITNTKSNEYKIFESTGQASEHLDMHRSTIQSRCDRVTIKGVERFEFLERTSRWANPIKEKLYLLGLSDKKSYDKFIPDIYKYNSSIKDRLNLLRGLMDSDGTIKKNGESSYTTISQKLANDVVHIVNSLGGRATIKTRDRTGEKHIDKYGRNILYNFVSYELSISLPDNMNPFYVQNKSQYHKCTYTHSIGIQSVDFVGEKEVQCILIDNQEHLYITDDFIVTHNTIDDKMRPWMAPLQDNLDLLFSEKGKGYLDMQRDSGIIEVEALTYIRGRSIPRSFIIVDECLTAGHKVSMFNGTIKNIEDIVEGDKVLALDIDKSDTVCGVVDGVISRDTQSITNIRVEETVLECSPNHPLYLFEDFEYKKVCAENVCVGDFIPSPRFMPHNVTNDLSADGAYFFGMILSDGHITKDMKTIKVAVKKDINHFKNKFIAGLNSFGHKDVYKDFINGRGDYTICFNRKKIITNMVNKFGLQVGNKSKTISVPNVIFGSPINSVKSFISACFDAEGDINVTKSRSLVINYSSASIEMVKGIQHLLKKFGIRSRRIKIKKQKNFTMYRVYITGLDAFNFYELIGFKMKRKNDVLVSHFSSHVPLDKSRVPVAKILRKRLKYSGIKRRNKLFASISSSHTVYRYMINCRYKEYFTKNELRLINSFNFSEVKSTKNVFAPEKVYDFRVKSYGTFCIDGIISSNCQNLTLHEAKTIITRIGEGSKVILTGDILQIDNPFIDSVDNGLSCVIEKFKHHPIAAHITLQKGERSELATLAAEIL